MDQNAGHPRSDKSPTSMFLSDTSLERLTRNITETAEGSSPCYYSNQKVLAAIIVERIRLLLQHYQDGRQLEDFTDFDFQIYTSKTNTLKEQTKGRLLNKDSGVIPPGYTDGEALKFAETRVHLYQYKANSKERKRHEELMKEALANPNKLFLIIADEAHWGITSPGEEGKLKAHDTLINQWHCDKYRNVIVLLVTATPYNLLTNQSSLPLKVFCAESLATGEFEIVKAQETVAGKRERLFKGEKDVTEDVGPKVRLHHVKWTETYSARFEKGVKMIIRTLVTSSHIKCSKPIYVGPARKKSNPLVSLVGYEDMSEELTLLVTGKNGKVKIFDSEKRKLTVFKVSKRYHVRFVDACCEDALYQSVPSMTDEFEMAMTFGEDIFALYPVLSDSQDKVSLYFDEISKKVRVHPKPQSKQLGNNVLTDAPVIDLFFIDRLVDIDGRNEYRYISLNYYYNTIWHTERNERKWRYDEAFEKLCKDMLEETETRSNIHSETNVLVAEYCIFVIVLSEFVKFLAPDREPCENIKDILKMVKNMTDEIKEKLAEFREILSQYEIDGRLIDQQPVADVEEHHQMLIQLDSEDSLTDCWKKILKASLFGSQDEVFKLSAKISGRNEVLTPYLIDHLRSLKEEIIDSYETGKIIADVMQIKEKNGFLQGSLKVIKVPDGDIASRLYYSVKMAREVACDGSCHNFDILRDDQDHKLANMFKGKQNKQRHKLHLLLQKKCCGNTEKGEVCPCDQYAPKNDVDIKCNNCNHPHNPVQKFEDLQGMPAILILVEKGNMGDTFPPNFNCMDLRIKDNKKYQLSTTVQLLGRLCRHNRQDDLQNIPYALLPKSLIDHLKQYTMEVGSEEGEQGNALIYSSFMQAGNIDRHTRVGSARGQGSRGDLKMPFNAASSNFDNKNKSKKGKSKGSKSKGTKSKGTEDKAPEDEAPVKLQTNKIILGAEPQCGKTGTYCYLIASLRTIICREVRMEDIEGECCDKDDVEEEDEIEEEDEEDDDDDDGDEEELDAAHEDAVVTSVKKYLPQDSEEKKWLYPYHKQMSKEKLNNKVTRSGKYTRIHGFWFPGKAPSRAVYHSLGNEQSAKDKASKPSTCLVPYKAECFSHKCSACRKEPDASRSAEFEILVNGYLTKLHVSDEEESAVVLQSLRLSNIQMRPPVPDLPASSTDLKTWIFVPTTGRARTACLNLKHTMCGPQSEVDSTEIFKTYVQVLVVPEHEYKQYCTLWGSRVTAIVQLPTSMTDDDGNVVPAVEGGIGYSRRFIHMFSFSLNLDRIFMMDDNVWFFREAKFEDGKVKRLPDGKVDFHCIPAFKVLSHMDEQFHPCTPRPPTDSDFQPYSGDSLSDLETYTGPSGNYAVLGVRRSRIVSEKVNKAFKKAHVYSLVLLNVKATTKKLILYKPWEAFEDLDFNESSNKQDLWVCKYNRFLMSKKKMRAVPSLSLWDEDTELTNDGLGVPAEDEVKILSSWIKHFVMPRRTWHLGQKNESLKELFEIVDRKRHGKDTFFAVIDEMTESSSGEDLKDSVRMVTEITKRATLKNPEPSSRQHAIALSVKTCLQCSVTKLADFKELLSGIFKEGFILHVATSHKVPEFKVNIVILVIQEDNCMDDSGGGVDAELPSVEQGAVNCGNKVEMNMEPEDPNCDKSESVYTREASEMSTGEWMDTRSREDLLPQEGMALSPPRSPSPDLLDAQDCTENEISGMDPDISRPVEIPDSPPRSPSPNLLQEIRPGLRENRMGQIDWSNIRKKLKNVSKAQRDQENTNIGHNNLSTDSRTGHSGQGNRRHSLPTSTAPVKRPRLSGIIPAPRQRALTLLPQSSNLTVRQNSHSNAEAPRNVTSTANNNNWSKEGLSDEVLIEYMVEWEQSEDGRPYAVVDLTHD